MGIHEPSEASLAVATERSAIDRAGPATTPGDRTGAYQVDAMDPGQRRTWRALLVVWALAFAAFWLWWLQSEHQITLVGMLFNSLLLLWTLILPAWFFFFVSRIKRPNPRLPLPRLRVAMVVTHAPSEPWGIVQATLEGMLRQDFPYPYDVWLADEVPTPEVRRWCDEHGVRISSRHGVSEWHRPNWPRRTKSKEGNLAYFYDSVGYRLYDVVAQFDADHVPALTYLREVIRPFNDPSVGYVAAPSINDLNRRASWAVRGRLFREGAFHGPYQAGRSGWAPSCIGSHYTVRTAALWDVGGVGPELAEDFSTTLLMNSGSWRGVFVLDAEAHGAGPESAADFLTQEFQWSRSLTNILLFVGRPYWPRVSRRDKVVLGFGATWYPLHGLHMSAGFLLPLVAIAIGSPWVNVSLPAFFLHLAPLSLASLAPILWLRRQGWLRPADSRILSWEAVLYQLTRWPWVLLGVLASLGDWVGRKGFSEKVTPKGSAGSRPLPLRMLAPFWALALIPALTALLPLEAGAARGYYYFCLVWAGTYLLVAVALVILHSRENPAPARSFRRRHAPLASQLACTALVAVPVAAAFALRAGDAYRALVPEGLRDDLAAVGWEAVEAVAASEGYASLGLVGGGALLALRLRPRRARRKRRGVETGRARRRR